ncbi:MAG: hypothetical protein E6J13_10330 [Chloroflexi bacterium]|nr:MAG: hypothetical protein E6J13_10330 [Chloroflexota bacterium]
MKKIALSLIATLALTALIAGSTASSAAAYGNDAVYQIEFSGNCDNPANFLCTNVFGVGGIWVWAALDVDHSGDATVAFCAHGLPTAPHGIAAGGPVEVTWSVVHWEGPPFAIGSVNQDPSNNYLAISTTQGPLITVPATPGHYSFRDGPAVQAQTQVVLIPGRVANP